MNSFKKYEHRDFIQYRLQQVGYCSVITTSLRDQLISYHIEIDNNYRINDMEQVYMIAKALDELKNEVSKRYGVKIDKPSTSLLSRGDTYINIRDWKIDNQTINSAYKYLFSGGCPKFIKDNIFITDTKIRMQPVNLSKQTKEELRIWFDEA